MVDDDGGEVVEARACVGAPRLVEVGEEVVGHVEAAQRELHVRVQLRPREGRPPEPLQVQAQHLQVVEMVATLNQNRRTVWTEHGPISSQTFTCSKAACSNIGS